jgi:hypothetical protein
LGKGAAEVAYGRSEAALDSFTQAHRDSLAIKADVILAEARIAMLEEVANRFGRLYASCIGQLRDDPSKRPPTSSRTSILSQMCHQLHRI